MVTPMYADGAVNYSQAAHLAEYLFEHGSDAVVVCGTTGESPTLGHDEHMEVIRLAIEYAAGRCQVIAGTGSNDTAYAIDMTKYACEIGYDAMLVVTP